MDQKAYLKSLADELESLKNRVRHFISDSHWLSDGEWKESALKSIIRRNLPCNIGIGNGFIVSEELVSTQIDILLYRNDLPVLFKDGDFTFVTTDSVVGIIEVKTKINSDKELKETIEKILNNVELACSKDQDNFRFSGLFVYEDYDPEKVLSVLENLDARGDPRCMNIISLGKDHFIRFWNDTHDKDKKDKWGAYHLNNMAPGYFINNIFAYMNRYWANQNDKVIFPVDGKENYLIDSYR